MERTPKGQIQSPHPTIQKLLHHPRIRQRRRIPQRAHISLGDLAQDTPHDLARAGLRQARRPVDHVRRGDRADLLADMGHQGPLQVVVRFDVGVESDIGVDALALDCGSACKKDPVMGVIGV